MKKTLFILSITLLAILFPGVTKGMLVAADNNSSENKKTLNLTIKGGRVNKKHPAHLSCLLAWSLVVIPYI